MLSDEQLMERLSQGDGDALTELYRRYSKKLYLFCFSVISTKDPEDVVHDVFMRVISAAHRFDFKKASFRTWLFRIARNRCIDLIRREGNIKMAPIEEKTGRAEDDGAGMPENTLADEWEGAEAALLRAAVVKAVRECLGGLKNQDEKQAIVLYYIGNKVYREIGDILGKSTSTAKNHLTAAQAKMKRCLEGKGVDGIP